MSAFVVHLFGRMDDGGAEMRFLDEVRHRQGRERHLCIALSGKAGSLDGTLADLDVEVVPRALTPTFPTWFVSFLRARGATHVHSHVQMASGYLLPLARLAGVPHRIAHLHTRDDGRARTGWRRLYRSAGRLGLLVTATSVVAVSVAVRDEVLGDGRLARRTQVVYDRVDGDRFSLANGARPGTAARLLFVGRLDGDKNPLRAVAVLAALRSREAAADTRLLMAGRATDAERAAVRARAKALGVGDAVEVLGSRDDVPELLAASDVLLSTSHREGLPGVVLEAAAAGIPAVVADIGPCEEVALHLPSVVPVPLAADDEVWSDVLQGVIARRADRFTPRRVRDGFDRSPFAIGDEADPLDDLWSTEVQR